MKESYFNDNSGRVIYRAYNCNQPRFKIGCFIIHRDKDYKCRIIGYSRPDPYKILCLDEQGYTYDSKDMLLHDVFQAEDLINNGFDLDKDLVSFYDVRYDIK